MSGNLRKNKSVFSDIHVLVGVSVFVISYSRHIYPPNLTPNI